MKDPSEEERYSVMADEIKNVKESLISPTEIYHNFIIYLFKFKAKIKWFKVLNNAGLSSQYKASETPVGNSYCLFPYRFKAPYSCTVTLFLFYKIIS